MEIEIMNRQANIARWYTKCFTRKKLYIRLREYSKNAHCAQKAFVIRKEIKITDFFNIS